MLKWAVTFVVNRLIALVVMMFVVSSFFRTSCVAGNSVVGQLEQALSGLKEISRALENSH
jgi:hypothetical protein